MHLKHLKLDLDDLGRNRRIYRSLALEAAWVAWAAPCTCLVLAFCKAATWGALVPCVICFGEDGVLKTLHCGFKAHVSLGYNLELTWTKHFMKMYENRAFFSHVTLRAKNLAENHSGFDWSDMNALLSAYSAPTILKALSQRLLVPEGFHPLPIDWHPLPSRIGRRT